MISRLKLAAARLRAAMTGDVGPFRQELEALLEARGTLNILQVGANDGKIGDPLHGFVRANAGRTRIVLVEPQPDLVPILRETYAFHPAAAIFQGAVGAAGKMTLHRVRKECWPDLVVPYAAKWPDYRAPTGVTSARRDLVLEWLAGHYRGSENPKSLVDEIEVDAIPTPELMARLGLFQRLDVLQIDAEGCDDQVIAASDIAGLRPSLINLEAFHLGTERFAALKADLERLGYEVHLFHKDALALRLDQA